MFKKLPINYISAFVIFIAVILWVLSGVLSESPEETEIIANKAEEKIIHHLKQIQDPQRLITKHFYS